MTGPPQYGYKQRQDPPAREIAGGASRVTLPNKEETRRTDIVSKTNFGVPGVILANVDDFYHFPQLTSAQTYVGKNAIISPSGANRWNADIKRYSRGFTSASSVFAERYQIGMSARALVDPLYPPSGIVVKMQDFVRAKFTGAINAQFAKAVWVMGPQGGSSTPTQEIASVGWRAVYSNLGVQPTWVTQYVSKNAGVTRNVDSGLQSDTPRLLSVVFDGLHQQIRWYADNVLVDTYSPSAGEVGGQNTLLGRETVQYICNSSNAVASGAIFDFLMLGVPLVTIQFPYA